MSIGSLPRLPSSKRLSWDLNLGRQAHLELYVILSVGNTGSMPHHQEQDPRVSEAPPDIPASLGTLGNIRLAQGGSSRPPQPEGSLAAFTTCEISHQWQ